MSEPRTPFRYAPIAVSDDSTVVAEFQLDTLGVRETAYQSEAELEQAFIHQLQQQAYEYLRITSEAELVANLRRQLEKLNKITLSEAEWERFSAPASQARMMASWKKPRAFKKTLCSC